jgi:hypothetical protein
MSHDGEAQVVREDALSFDQVGERDAALAG